MTDKEKIAKTLRDRRKQRGMTMDELAAEMGKARQAVSRATLYRYEAGETMPTLPMYLTLCQVLELDPRAYQRA